ncbi:MAG TPA: hypothetical protein VHD36_11615 [Pirellulales bacterium]|nr:hypothetical protein [Pirellulales bacterium]
MKRMTSSFWPCFLIAWLAAGSCCGPATALASETVEELIGRGVRLESGEIATLPAPQMPDGLSPDEQQAALRKAAGKYPLDRFVRKSVVAPFSLEIGAVDDAAGRRRGQHVDFCFVAYGQLSTVIEEDLFGQLAGAQESGRADDADSMARALTSEELQSRGLKPVKNARREESYVRFDLPILNRVQLRGVGFAVREKRAHSVIAALVLDDHFRDDKQFPNSWSPLARDPQGKLTVEAAKPYSGLGGYMKMTELAEPAGALFVECHIAFDEPEAWFHGKNFLRSKLPLVVQDNVRTFRRKLSKDASASEEE